LRPAKKKSAHPSTTSSDKEWTPLSEFSKLYAPHTSYDKQITAELVPNKNKTNKNKNLKTNPIWKNSIIAIKWCKCTMKVRQTPAAAIHSAAACKSGQPLGFPVA